MNLDVDAQITCGLFWNTKKKKKKIGNHSQRKASEHLIYSVSQLKKKKKNIYSVQGRSMKTSLGCNYFDSKYQTDRHED